ncbi:periostin [Caerostris extrusa]|uniref:Periostin n=1 Tax=Caerostris extrusa TaxID=172846 RepID=A0AAV4NDX0_CAEEX|nr:periostin [Caerostris extrusa]
MLTNFTKILKVSGLDSTLSSGGPYTLFAPNACAFSEMDLEGYRRLITNKKLAIDFVKRYMVRKAAIIAMDCTMVKRYLQKQILIW